MKVDKKCSVLDTGVINDSCTGAAFSALEGRKIVAQGKGVSDGGQSRPLGRGPIR